MKTPSNSLHQLIASLSPSEKKYFRQYSLRHIHKKEPVYLKLFDAIEKQEVYDENEIKKIFRKEVFIKQLFVAKNYLHEMILRALAAFHNGKTSKGVLMNDLNYIDILFDKGLYELCLKVIEKAEKLAEKSDNFSLHLEILDRKLNTLRASGFYKLPASYFEKLFNEKQRMITKLTNLYDLEKVNTIFIHKETRKGWLSRSEEEIKNKYLPLTTHNLLSNEQSAVSLSAKILRHSTLSSCYYLMGESEKSYHHSAAALKIFEKSPALVSNNQTEYIHCISSVIYNLVALKNFDSGLRQIEKAKKLDVNSPSLKAKIISSVHLNEIVIYNLLGKLDKGISMIPLLEVWFAEYEHYLSQTDICYFYYNFSCLYFKKKDYEKASKYLLMLLNEPNAQFLANTIGNARMLNLMIQYELDNTEVLPYLTRSTHRFLLKENHLSEFENAFLKFIRQLLSIPPDEQHQAFNTFYQKAHTLIKNSPEKNALDSLPVIEWLNNRIS